MAHIGISPDKLASLLALARERKESSMREALSDEGNHQNNLNPNSENQQSTLANLIQGIDRYGKPITFNSAQSEFIRIAESGTSAVLIGAAGTGKTSCMNGAITALIQSGRIPIISDNDSHKYISLGTPGIIACSYTRRAVANLRKAMPEDMRSNCITIHKLLEYQPVDYYIVDPESGEEKKSMKFAPTRNSYSPLPRDIRCIIIDEASMVSVELFNQLVDALPHRVQFIFLGDIQQLPPVFGSAVLGYKMLEFKCIELTEVYRQALDSPIISYATKIKSGEEFLISEKMCLEGKDSEGNLKGKLTFHPWKKKLTGENACLTFAKFITVALDAGGYNPDEDMILLPFNKAFGTEEINKSIANHIARKQGRTVWEVVSGFNRLYFSVGDRVLYDKEDAIITHIAHNESYTGAKPKKESTTLDYWGYDSNTSAEEEDYYSEHDVDKMLDQMAAMAGSPVEDRVRQASHIITVQMLDTGQEIAVDTASTLNSLLLSYALTVHKAQGSEWQKVFFILHQSHATMTQRELLYTGLTRAAFEAYVLCEPDTFVKGVRSQKIKGNTLAEKAEYFKGKLNDGSIPQ